MSFSRMTGATDHVARLPDRPGAAEGYTPQALKAVFDQGATQIKEYLNGVLLRELEATGQGASAAERLGSAWIEGLTGQTVHQQLCSLLQGLQRVDRESKEALMGQIPDGSLTESKLDPLLAALLREKASAPSCYAAYTQAGEYRFVAPVGGRYRVRLVGAGGGGTLCCPQGQATGSFDATGGPSGAYAEATLVLEQGAGLSLTVGKGGEPFVYSQGQQLSSQEYYADYLGQMRYHAPGGESAVYLTAQTRLTAAGGDGTSEGERAKIHGEWEEGAITRSGLPYAFLGDRLLRFGADSFVGQGGGFGVAAGAGAGGEGGRLYLGEDGDIQVLELPCKGGDGAVWVEYLGGNE